MPIIEIDDQYDPRIAPYRDIRERDLVGREGRFIAEGKVVLNVALASRYEIESLFVLRRRLAGIEELISSRPELPVYVAEDDVMSAIAGFDVHRGVLGLGLKPDVSDWRALLTDLPENALVVICVGISNHDNIGSIFRNAAAFGAAAVLLDETCCDPFYRKALRVSVGGVLKVPFARFTGLDELGVALAASGFRQLALTPRGATDIAQVQPGGRLAIYLGAEGEGLPDALMARMETVRIPIASDFDSLNVAATSAIVLHRLAARL